MKDRFGMKMRSDEDSRRHFRETKDNIGQRADDRDRDEEDILGL